MARLLGPIPCFATSCRKSGCPVQIHNSASTWTAQNLPAGVCCHFCRQKKLCAEEDCVRCSVLDDTRPCTGQPICAAQSDWPLRASHASFHGRVLATLANCSQRYNADCCFPLPQTYCPFMPTCTQLSFQLAFHHPWYLTGTTLITVQ